MLGLVLLVSLIEEYLAAFEAELFLLSNEVKGDVYEYSKLYALLSPLIFLKTFHFFSYFNQWSVVELFCLCIYYFVR